MIKGQIHTTESVVDKGVGKKSGKAYAMRKQAVMLTFPNGEVRKFDLVSGEDDKALPVGLYEPKGSAFYLDGFDLKVSSDAKHWQAAKS